MMLMTTRTEVSLSTPATPDVCILCTRQTDMCVASVRQALGWEIQISIQFMSRQRLRYHLRWLFQVLSLKGWLRDPPRIVPWWRQSTVANTNTYGAITSRRLTTCPTCLLV